jgi:hypothetical protein
MPKLLYARPPNEPVEEHNIRKRSGRGALAQGKQEE